MNTNIETQRDWQNAYTPELRRKRRRSLLISPADHNVYNLNQFHNDIPLADQDTSDNDEGRADTNARKKRENTTLHGIASDNIASRSEYSSDHNLPKSLKVYDENTCEDFTRVKAYESVFRRLVWPASVICIPMLLLSAALLYVIFRYLIEPIENIFDPKAGLEHFKDHRYLLVNFSATKLVFLASFLSTMAPLLAGCILQLTAVLVYQEIVMTSHVRHFPTLLTPYQMGLLAGILSASYEQLFNAFVHLGSRKRRARVSPVLVYAVLIFLISILLGLGVTSLMPTCTLLRRRGINSYCLGVDRVKDNYGFPCTYAKTTELSKNKDFQDGQPEIQRVHITFRRLRKCASRTSTASKKAE